MANSAVWPNFILSFLILYFGIVIEGEEKYSVRQLIYIILFIIDASILVYINRSWILENVFSKFGKKEAMRAEDRQDEVKEYIE
jgi:hypothetical protein